MEEVGKFFIIVWDSPSPIMHKLLFSLTKLSYLLKIKETENSIIL